MSTFLGFNHLITKRIQSSFGKSKDNQSKSKKLKDKSISSNLEGMSLNQSVDVKTHMSRQKNNMIRQRPSNTINFESEGQKGRKHNILFTNSKRDLQAINNRSVKLAYGSTSPKAIRHRMNIYTSQKSMKEKKKRLSFSSNIRGQSQVIQNNNTQSPLTVHTNTTKQNQTVSVQKHLIIAKYDKVKQLLQQQKYSQATIYLKQIIPYIEDSGKRKELYFWLIASLMKCNTSNKLEMIENYIVECLEEFPNFYDVYLYWGKIKLSLSQTSEAVEIYEKAISINPKSSQAYSELANLYFKQQAYSQSLKVLKQGFEKSINSVSIPIKVVQNYHQFKLCLRQDVKTYVKRIQQNCGRKSTEFLYVLGFVEAQSHNINEALIYFLQSLKYNSNKTLATKSLQQVIKIHISKKDFYAACYDLKRAKHLNIDVKKIEKYEIFLQGVNFVMKKKNEEGIKLLTKIKESIPKPSNSKKRINSFFVVAEQEQQKVAYFPEDSEIFSLTIQYLAYANFKLGNHKQSIKCYKLLQKVEKQLDKTSKYNMLLAEGVVLADSYHDFQLAFAKFQQAKSYMSRVEPYIYQSVVTVQKCIYQQKIGENKKVVVESLAEDEVNASVIEALNLMEQGYQVNSSSSNLLYHRTILHLYFSSVKSALNDVNVCIQKAEENLPKYFYLRGICFACMKNLKKAINEFSISISLSKEYSLSYLQRAKCYFLTGQTEMGFQDLKVYMDQCPDDYHVHKWIGDLLFEGTSYNDSIKAYNEMGEKITLQALCMRMKAQLRVGTGKQVSQTVGRIKSHQSYSEQVFGIDLAAYGLLSILMMKQSGDKEKHILSIQKKVKQLNDYLQSDVEKGKIFNLVDCMCLVGIGSFYIQKYTEAYEAFLLVFEFFKSTNVKHLEKSQIQASEDQSMEQSRVKNQKLNTEFQEENLDLREEDIYYNLFLCLLALRDRDSIQKLVDEQMMSTITTKTQRKSIERIVGFVNQQEQNVQRLLKTEKNPLSSESGQKNLLKNKNKKQLSTCILEPRVETPLNVNMRKFEIPLTVNKNTLIVKTSLIWSPYHGTNENLNFTSNAKKLVNQLHAGYIDNMPEGPWIRRNEFGVVFTDNILDEGNESSFITTNRNDEAESPQQQNEDYEEGDEYEHSLKRLQTGSSENMNERKKAFLKEMRLDLKIESKLNKIIKKNESDE